MTEALSAAAARLALRGRWSVVALGSYARGELCPGSDVDVMLVHDGSSRGGALAAASEVLWYPLWDAGFVLGHASRTVKEAVGLAADDVDVLTGLLDLRPVAGDASLAADVVTRARALARKREGRVLATLAEAAAARVQRPGPIAEMLDPNLKEGAGGLRDVHALTWAGWVLGDAGGLATLVDRGHIAPGDPLTLARARDVLLDVRVALHRTTGRRTDALTLQEQDAVASELGVPDADALVRELAGRAREVRWIAGDAWDRMLADGRKTGRRPRARDMVGDGIVLSAGRITVAGDGEPPLEQVMAAAAAASVRDVTIDRTTLERFRSVGEAEWTTGARSSFLEVLRAGRSAIPVLESLDHVGVLVSALPEWRHVRAHPQRNAYHRFTVDRHLLETVAECAALLDDEGFDGVIARRTRPDLLLLGALLHDIGKGVPGDHSIVGVELAVDVATRIGTDPHGVDVLAWLVRSHLLLADTATRRDLSDEETIIRFGRAVGDTERLDLLYALTIGDSRATGPSSWSTAKAALVRQLFVQTDTLLEDGVVGPGLDAERRRAFDLHHEELARGELAMVWDERPDGLLECTVVAPDRTGLLANVTGVLALSGFDIQTASVYTDPATGMALEVFRGVDRFERLDEAGRRDVAVSLRSALAGAFPLRERLGERILRYRSRPRGGAGVTVKFDLDASSSATVVEVHAPDDVGLLARVTATFADLDLDVTAALVSTTGTQVVDVFYVRDGRAAKVTEPLLLDQLRATLIARLTTDYLLP